MPNPTDERTRCTAHNRKGAVCSRYAIPGGTVCRYHGGNAPQVKAKATQRLTEARVVQEMHKLGHPVDIGHLHEEMIDCVRAAKGDVVAYRQMVAELDSVTGMDTGPGGAHYETVRSTVKLYHEALAFLARVVKMAIDVGVDERLVRVSEAQTSILFDTLQAALTELGLADDPRAKEVVARHLRAVG